MKNVPKSVRREIRGGQNVQFGTFSGISGISGDKKCTFLYFRFGKWCTRKETRDILDKKVHKNFPKCHKNVQKCPKMSEISQKCALFSPENTLENWQGFRAFLASYHCEHMLFLDRFWDQVVPEIPEIPEMCKFGTEISPNFTPRGEAETWKWTTRGKKKCKNDPFFFENTVRI